MKRIAIGVALAATSVFLVGCGSNDGPQRNTPEPVYEAPRNANEYQELQEVAGTVEKITVDGVTCIVYDGNSSGGISCDWSMGGTR